MLSQMIAVSVAAIIIGLFTLIFSCTAAGVVALRISKHWKQRQLSNQGNSQSQQPPDLSKHTNEEATLSKEQPQRHVAKPDISATPHEDQKYMPKF